jgi:hypothetical protein
MKRYLRGTVLLAATVGVWACSGDPTGDINGEPTRLVSNPSSVFIDQGDSAFILVSAKDDAGGTSATVFEVSAVGEGITVTRDTLFQGVYDGVGDFAGVSATNSARYSVKGIDFKATSFTVSAAGQTLVIPVKVAPAKIDFTFSSVTPALGDSVEVTAPAGTFFTPQSRVTFAAGPVTRFVSVSADGSTLRFLPGPNTSGAASITNVGVSYNDTLRFTAVSKLTLTNPNLRSVTGVFSTQTPALGAPVTLTLPADVRVLPDSAKLATILGASLAPLSITVSADSGTITFVPPPNADSTLLIPGIVHRLLPQFPQRLETTLKLTTPVLTKLVATTSTNAPAAGAPVTLTITGDPALTFKNTTTAPVITIGGRRSLVQSISADKRTLVFLAAPSSADTAITVAGIDVAGFNLTLTTTSGAFAAANASTMVALPGSNAVATAPVIAAPVAVGDYSSLFDVVGGVDENNGYRQYYSVTIPTTGKYTLRALWPTGADMDFQWRNATNTGSVAGQTSAATLANPETSTATLTGGTTYIIRVFNFGAGIPPYFGMQIRRDE